MTLLTEFKDKTASLARLLTAAMTSMLLLGILAPSGSGGTSDGVLNFSNTPFALPAAYDHYIRCSGRGDRPRPGHNHVRHQPGRDDLRDATLTRAVRFTLFLRTPDGAIITFDAPGAGTGPGRALGPSASTRQARARATTTTRAVCFTVSCALRTVSSLPSTSRVRAQVPARVPSPATSTRAEAIAGRYVDASDVAHGFLRAPNGTITTFDAPNAGTGPGQGTFVFTGYLPQPRRGDRGSFP